MDPRHRSTFRGILFGALIALSPWSVACDSDREAAAMEDESERSVEPDGGSATEVGADAGTRVPSEQADAPAWSSLANGVRSHFANPLETRLSARNAAELKERYVLTTRGYVTGTPALVGDDLFVVAQAATYLIDAPSGEIVWENREVFGSSSPTHDRGVLYVSAALGTLHALDAATGVQLWETEVDPHPATVGWSSPVVAGDLVLLGNSSVEEGTAVMDATFMGGVVAFDRETGEQRWRHDPAEPPFNGASVWSSVSVDLDAAMVFATTGNNYTEEANDRSDAIFAADLHTGELLWNTQLHEGDVFNVFTAFDPEGGPDYDFGTNPVLFEAEIEGEARALVGAGQKSGVFWALDRDTGEEVWSVEVGPGGLLGGVLNNGAYDGERVLVASHETEGETTRLVALSPADGAVLWERELDGLVTGPITTGGGVGFVPVSTRMLAFDVSDGEPLYEIETDATVSSGAAISGGRVAFGSGTAFFGFEMLDTVFIDGQALYFLSL